MAYGSSGLAQADESVHGKYIK